MSTPPRNDAPHDATSAPSVTSAHRFASPSGSILKRRHLATSPRDSPSPPAKQRRVSFAKRVETKFIEGVSSPRSLPRSPRSGRRLTMTPPPKPSSLAARFVRADTSICSLNTQTVVVQGFHVAVSRVEGVWPVVAVVGREEETIHQLQHSYAWLCLNQHYASRGATAARRSDVIALTQRFAAEFTRVATQCD